MAEGYSRRQWMVLITFSLVNFCNMACVSLQGPFFPAEAELKGAMATQYGLVFGIFQLVVFLVSPFYGTYIDQIGPKFMFNAGVFSTAGTCILFGFLNHVDGATAFISLAFAVRIVEAIGSAAIPIVSNSMIANEFPNDVGATFATLQTWSGLGLIVGPALGGLLYELGGFTLPFVVLGITFMASAVMTACLLPGEDPGKKMIDSDVSMLSVVKIPSIALFSYIIMAASFSIGFQVTLTEPHLRSFHLTPAVLGLMFVLQGGAYALTAPLWGWLCDKKITPRVSALVGGLLVVLSFLLFGPAPYIPLPNTIWGCIISLFLFGVGLGGELVGAFSGMLQEVFHAGYPNNLSTYGLVSGIFTSAFSLGFFLGPVVGGVLMDVCGFRWASMVVVAVHLLVVLGIWIYFCYSRRLGVYGFYRELAMEDEKFSISSVVANKSYGGIGETRKFYETTKPQYESI